MTWIPKAELAIANDLTMATTIENTSSLAFAAVNAIVVDQIGSDSTVIAAAAAAVEEAAEAEGFPTTDPVVSDEFEFAIADEDGVPSWLQVDGSGRPTVFAGDAIANVLHEYTGPTAPTVWPGNWVLWTQTDETHYPIDLILVEG